MTPDSGATSPAGTRLLDRDETPRSAWTLRCKRLLLLGISMALASPPPVAAALVIKWMTIYTSRSGESASTASSAVYLNGTVARFLPGKGASFDAYLVDLEAETATFLFFEKKAAGVLQLRSTAEWLQEKVKGTSLNVELRPTQRTKDFGTRTCREHSARVAVSVDRKVTRVTLAPPLEPQRSLRLKPEWQWVLEGKVWLAAPAPPSREDIRFRSELESRQLTLQFPDSGHPERWLRDRIISRLHATSERRGDLCAESLTYTPPPGGLLSLFVIGPEASSAVDSERWYAETVSTEESEVGNDQFTVPPGFTVVEAHLN